MHTAPAMKRRAGGEWVWRVCALCSREYELREARDKDAELQFRFADAPSQ